jgi:NAD(P)-dependent dehydrogenase (short-subunit alcohol dehydrogenase family)
MKPIDLGGKVGLVTGSTRGIGRAIAEEMARAGATVVVSGRKDEDVARVVEELKAEGHRAFGASCDVRRYDDVEALVRFAVERAGGLDVLVNNAGIGLFLPVSEIEPSDWDDVIGTNLTGVFYCSRAAIPFLKKRGGGTIVNVSSLAGKNAFAGGAAYNASKFGLEGLSEAMMLDLRYENIKVAYVMPGSVATEFAGRGSKEGEDWRLTGQDVAEVVLDILAQDHRALASRIELRPFQPPRKS